MNIGTWYLLYRKMKWLEVSDIAKVIGSFPENLAYVLAIFYHYDKLLDEMPQEIKGLFYCTVSASFLHYAEKTQQ